MFQIITRRRNVIVETVHPLILCASPIPDASCWFSEVSSFTSCLECFFEDSFSEDFHFMLDLTNEDICLIELTMSFNPSAWWIDETVLLLNNMGAAILVEVEVDVKVESVNPDFGYALPRTGKDAKTYRACGMSQC